MKTTEIGNYRIEEHSSSLFGTRRITVMRVGKKRRDGSTDMHVVGWYQTHEEAVAAVSKDGEKHSNEGPR